MKLTNHEGAAIKPMLPDKQGDIPALKALVSDRHRAIRLGASRRDPPQ
jgi:hypothetical protein